MNDDRAEPVDRPGTTGTPATAGGPDAGPARRRRHRRAVGGTAPTEAAVPDALGRSRDDTDEGWGERPGGDDDERILREVPPHW
ncbi:MAG: hypothetical protein H5T83_13940 [Actinotalea sp.]|nr:hypothetical protein [Actinotalea sp.]